MRGGVHRKTGSQGSVYANDERVLTGAAVPWLEVAMHEVLHLREPLDRVRHHVAGLLFFDQPVEHFAYLRSVLRTGICRVLVEVLEVGLLDERRLIDVIVRGDAVLSRDLCLLLGKTVYP
jgi:hypothetical protein